MDFSTITTPTRVTLLISFMDIQGFLGIAQAQHDLTKLFDLLNNWAGIIIKDVERAHGRVVKFIGDACLIVFAEEDADLGVQTLVSLKAKAEAFLREQGFKNRIKVTGHVGEAVMGAFGTGNCTSIDVFGDSVNIASTLERSDHHGRFVLSPQAFRKLSPSTRKLFHKYTPPVVYVAEE
jgi:class 3 adenylate cyclase